MDTYQEKKTELTDMLLFTVGKLLYFSCVCIKVTNVDSHFFNRSSESWLVARERRAGVVGVGKLWLGVIEKIFDVMAGYLTESCDVDEAFDLNVTSHEIAEQTPPWASPG